MLQWQKLMLSKREHVHNGFYRTHGVCDCCQQSLYYHEDISKDDNQVFCNSSQCRDRRKLVMDKYHYVQMDIGD